MIKLERIVVAFVINALWSSFAAAQPLDLSRALESALESHPKLRSSEAKVEAAQGDQMAARGAFDLKFYADGSYSPVGKYSQPRAEVGVKQPTTLWGAELYAKYQNGADFAPYDGAYVTSEAGKASLGILIPLIQGRAIDQRRLKRMQTALEVTIAEEVLRSTRADVLAGAASAWWKWRILSKKREIYQLLLSQALARQQFLVEQVEVGAIARVEAVDNQRLVAQRRAKLVALDWEFKQQTLYLSLYCREQDGTPSKTDSLQLPRTSLQVFSPRLRFDELNPSLESAPGANIYLKALEILDAEIRAAHNEQLPRLDFEVFGSRSFGEVRPYSSTDTSVTETAVGGKLSLSLDVQRRKARGKARSLSAKRRALEQDRRLFLDTLRVEAQGSLAALQAQYEMTELNQEATSFAQQVTEAESESLELGQSSVLAVNLREQAQASAYLSELDSLFEFHQAWIELQRLLGKQEVLDYLPPQSEPGADERDLGGEQ